MTRRAFSLLSLGDVILDAEESVAQAMKKMINGTSRGSVIPASPQVPVTALVDYDAAPDTANKCMGRYEMTDEIPLTQDEQVTVGPLTVSSDANGYVWIDSTPHAGTWRERSAFQSGEYAPGQRAMLLSWNDDPSNTPGDSAVLPGDTVDDGGNAGFFGPFLVATDLTATEDATTAFAAMKIVMVDGPGDLMRWECAINSDPFALFSPWTFTYRWDGSEWTAYITLGGIGSYYGNIITSPVYRTSIAGAPAIFDGDILTIQRAGNTFTGYANATPIISYTMTGADLALSNVGPGLQASWALWAGGTVTGIFPNPTLSNFFNGDNGFVWLEACSR